MPGETEGEFRFVWNISKSQLLQLERGPICVDPICEGTGLECTGWHLELQLNDNCYETYLCRHDMDRSKTKHMSVRLKFELIGSCGATINSVVREDTFPNGVTKKVPGLLPAGYIERFTNDKEAKMADSLTIRCHIMEYGCGRQTMTWNDTALIQTRWKIETLDFSNWPKKIQIPLHEDALIYITMSVSDEIVNIGIVKADLPQPYKIRVSALDSNDVEIDFKKSANIFHSTDKIDVFFTQIEKCQLVDRSCPLGYKFSLICTVIFSYESSLLADKSFSFSYPAEKTGTAFSLPLQADLKEMLLNGKHSDMKLRVHDKIIPVHKCLLSARSPVFSSKFDEDMLVKQTGIVDIPDVESEILQLFLEFLYTNVIASTNFECALKLLKMADKYQVNTLKDQCSRLLTSLMSPESVCEVISVADQVSLSDLKQSAITYIKENKKEIISSPFWRSWIQKNTKLANEILEALIIG